LQDKKISMKKFEKIKCGCGKTVAFKVDNIIEVKCRECGQKVIIVKQIQLELVGAEKIA